MNAAQVDLYQVWEGDDDAVIFLFSMNFLIHFLTKIKISFSQELQDQLL